MDSYCRICTRSDEFEKISLTTVSQVGRMRIDDMLVFCTQLEITTEDGLPQQICTECLAALNSTFLFRKQCYRTDETFHGMLEKGAFEPNIPLPPEPQEPPLPPLVPIVKELLPALEPIAHDGLSEITIKEELLEPDEFLDSAVNEYNESLAVDEEGTSEDTDRIEKDEVQKKVKPYICDKCGYSTTFSVNFQRHKNMRQNCALERARVSERKKHFFRTMKALSENPSMEHPNVYFCEVCGYSSNNKYNFRRHQKTLRHQPAEKNNEENTVQYLASSTNETGVLPESMVDVPIEIASSAENAEASSKSKTIKRKASKSNKKPMIDKTPVLFVCKECGYSTKSSSNFLRHQKLRGHTVYGKIIIKQNPIPPPPVPVETEDEEILG